MYSAGQRGKVQDIGVSVDKQRQMNYRSVILVSFICGYFVGGRCEFYIKKKSIDIVNIFTLKFLGENWFGVNLDEFAGCKSNLAINRQTRMLSDLALVGCYNQSSMTPFERDRIMLASAKRNLAAMSYFGLTEFQKVSVPSTVHSLTIHISICFYRSHSTYSKKHSIFGSLSHSNSTMQPFQVQQ